MSRRNVVRSRSAPPSRSDIARTLEVDDTESFPPLLPEHGNILDTPVWLRELSTLRSSRHSRASSIISTRTRFSTTTLDEVRSIEFTAGSSTFRISRDGSKVTDTTAPPPYAGHSWDDEDNGSDDEDAGDYYDEPEVVANPEQSDSNVNNGNMAREHFSEETQHRGRGKRVRIVMPGEEDEDATQLQDGESPTSANRVLTKADLYQLMWDLPFRLKRVLGLRPVIPTRSSILSRDGKEDQLGMKARPLSSQSLPDSFQPGSSEPIDFMTNDVQESNSRSLPSSSNSMRPEGYNESITGSADLQYPLTVTDLNELSSLYNRVIKDLDREHRKQLHERDKEMAQLRSLLNEKDIVYRQQLRGKDFVIEDLRKRLDHNEDVMEARAEHARHEVEDIWERRWKEREKHLLDHIRGMEDNGQRSEGGHKLQ